MDIYITGKSPKITKPEIKKAVRFYGSKLLRSDTYDKIYLEIALTSQTDGFYGFCEWIGTNYRPKDFLITLNNRLCRKTTLQNLAHEMVHLRQYATNQLFDYMNNDNVRWKKSLYDQDEVKYMDRPWEIQAYELEDILYEQYVKEFDDNIT